MNKIFKNYINIVNYNIKKNIISEIKDDGSFVTNIDKSIELCVIEYLQKNFENISIISEEFNNNQNIIDLNKCINFAVIDPIDGTENFINFKYNYGSVLSYKSNNKIYSIIYIPSINKFISNYNISSLLLNTENKIVFRSTSCINTHLDTSQIEKSNVRILGSSSYMFYLLLTSNAYGYEYCSNCKIWDCYTGLHLTLLSKRYKIILNNINIVTEKDLNENIKFYNTFKIYKK